MYTWIISYCSVYLNLFVMVIRFCAHEYERTNEMPTAALAYKCMEVAHMKVIFSSHATNCKVVNELRTSLPIGPTGASSTCFLSFSDLISLRSCIYKVLHVWFESCNLIILAWKSGAYFNKTNFQVDILNIVKENDKDNIFSKFNHLKLSFTPNSYLMTSSFYKKNVHYPFYICVNKNIKYIIQKPLTSIHMVFCK